MTVSRIDLDGAASPRRLAARIHQLADFPDCVPLEQLCGQLDIASISQVHSDSFEAALITDKSRSSGDIMLAGNRPRRRKRFSLGHELGHFLLEHHQPRHGGSFECYLADLHQLDPRDRDRRRRMEAEANRFAADLLMPPERVRTIARAEGTSLQTITAMADDSDVSKEAMGRAFVDSWSEPVALVLAQNHKIIRSYKHEDFPFLVPRWGEEIPDESIAAGTFDRGDFSDAEEIEPEVWLADRDCDRTLLFTEQVHGQSNGYSLILLQAELDDPE